MNRPRTQVPEGPRKTTGLTGRKCKNREVLSLPLLIGRETWPPPLFESAEAAVKRGQSKAVVAECWFCEFGFAGHSWLVAPAGKKHPFPSRTRPLSAPAAMILRSRARESSTLPTFFFKPRGRPTTPGLFFWCALRAHVPTGASPESAR